MHKETKTKTQSHDLTKDIKKIIKALETGCKCPCIQFLFHRDFPL